jgi:hypothetical protein
MCTQKKVDRITDGNPRAIRSTKDSRLESPMPCSRLGLAGAYLILIAGIVPATLVTASGANLF